MWLSQLAFIHHRRGDHFRNTDILSFLCLDSPATWGNTGERYAQPRQFRNRLFECDTLDRNRWLGRVWGLRLFAFVLSDCSCGRGRPRGQGHHQVRDLPASDAAHRPDDAHTASLLAQRRTRVRGELDCLGCRFLFCLAKTLAWRSAQSSLAVPVFVFFPLWMIMRWFTAHTESFQFSRRFAVNNVFF